MCIKSTLGFWPEGAMTTASRASRASRGMAFSRRRFLGAAAGIAVGAAGAGALELGWHRDSTAPPRSHYRAIVVGSGYGGGVSALRLGEAGVNTLILEK